MPLVRAAAADTALSKASGPSRMAPSIWPRSAILHSAAASSVAGMCGIDGLDRRQDGHARPRDAERMREVDRVADDVGLVGSVGAMLIAASVMMNGRG